MNNTNSLLTATLVLLQTKTNARMEHITATLTLTATTHSAHLTVLVFQVIWEMACDVLVREHYVIILLEIACVLVINCDTILPFVQICCRFVERQTAVHYIYYFTSVCEPGLGIYMSQI